MKRMLLALAVVGLAGVGSTRADWGGFGPPAPQAGPPVQPIRNEVNAPHTLMGLGAGNPGHAPDRYGLLPALFSQDDLALARGGPGRVDATPGQPPGARADSLFPWKR